MGVALTCSLSAREDKGCSHGYRQATELLNQGKAEQVTQSFGWMAAKCSGFYPAYIVLGIANQRLQHFEMAEQYFRQAVKLAPQSAVTHVNLGMYYLSRDHNSQASLELRKAVALDPKEPAGWVDLGLSELKAGDAAKAVEHLRKAIQLAPGNGKISLILISAAFKAGEPRLAREQADQLLNRKPQDPGMLLALGTSLEEGGEASRARGIYQSVKNSFPNPLLQFLEAANQAAGEGNYRAALSLLEFVGEVGKHSAEWNEAIGDAYYKLGQIKPAVDHLQAAVKLDPHNEDYYLEFGTLLTQYHANHACLALFQSATRILPNSVRIKSALAVAYLMEKKYAEAEEALQSIVAASPNYLPAYQLLGETYQASHQWEPLKGIGRQIVSRDPNQSVGWYYQAKADYELAMKGNKEFNIAESEVRRSLVLDSTNGPAHFLLGKILSAENRGQDAVLALKKAASLDDDPTVLYTLALAYRKLGEASKSAGALKEFNEAVERKKASYQKLNVKVDESQEREAIK
ncbi:MAG TPA: tetratricopeptide repeat protein [Terriglobia bacterium]|nr:tetratricopeptide repeat protein [Terriglobia bacterium]